MQISKFLLSVLLGIYRSGIVILNLIFLKLLYSHGGCTIFIPASIVQGFQVLCILANTCYFLSFFKIVILIKWYLIVVLIWVSLMNDYIEHLLMCYWPSLYFAQRNVYSVFYIWVFYCWGVEVLYIFCILAPYQIMIYKFFPIP